MKKKETIAAIKDQDEKVIHSVYVSFKPKFDHWLKGSYKVTNREDRNEIYQRSFTILYLNTKKGKLDQLDASIQTYLFGIGKMVMHEWWREKSSVQNTLQAIDGKNLEKIDLFSSVFKGNKQDELKEQLLLALNQLGDPCKSILKLFYWEQNSMEAIARKTGYKNEAGAKKKKYLCLEKLRKIMKKKNEL